MSFGTTCDVHFRQDFGRWFSLSSALKAVIYANPHVKERHLDFVQYQAGQFPENRYTVVVIKRRQISKKAIIVRLRSRFNSGKVL